MKAIRILTTLMFSFISGAMIGQTAGIDPLVMGGIGLGASLLPKGIDALCADLYPEIWTGILIKNMRNTEESIGWFKYLRDMSQYAKNNDVIHMTDIGVDPDVLINNSTYPLDIQNLEDGDKAFKLDKYQTKPTRITDDELNNLSYDKKATVVERHKEAFAQTKYSKALHSIAPSEDTSKTPVLVASGPVNEEGRTTLVIGDIIRLKKSYDKMKYPTTGRILVLCADHVGDLLLNNQNFEKQYYNYTSGKIANMHGFEVYEYVDAPRYHVTTLKKLAWGATATSSYKEASIAFHTSRVVRAEGSTKAYLQDAANSPTTQENLLSFRHYFVALAVRNEGLGAIVSGSGEMVPASELTQPSIKLSVSQLSFPKSGSTKQVTVTAPCPFTVSGEIEGFTYVVGENSLKVTTQANTGEERTGELTLELESHPGITAVLSLTQAKGN